MGLSLETSAPLSHRDPVSRALLHSVLPAGLSPARDAGGKSDAGKADAEGVILRSAATKDLWPDYERFFSLWIE